jgi:hypothetical protein
MMTGQVTPVPAGAFNPTSGNVLFILNNQVKSAPPECKRAGFCYFPGSHLGIFRQPAVVGCIL